MQLGAPRPQAPPDVSDPWALGGIAERLLEAVSRGLWKSPGEGVVAALKATYLDLEGGPRRVTRSCRGVTAWGPGRRCA